MKCIIHKQVVTSGLQSKYGVCHVFIGFEQNLIMILP